MKSRNLTSLQILGLRVFVINFLLIILENLRRDLDEKFSITTKKIKLSKWPRYEMSFNEFFSHQELGDIVILQKYRVSFYVKRFKTEK